MKKYSLPLCFSLLIVFMISCEKQDQLSSQPTEEPRVLFMDFTEDSIAVKLPVTEARKESIGNVFTTAIEGKLPDSVSKKNSLIIRITGDSARTYTRAEILASYTDSAGVSYANNTADTINKVIISKIENKKEGAVEGSFTIRVRNSTQTKTIMLKDGKFSTVFPE